LQKFLAFIHLGRKNNFIVFLAKDEGAAGEFKTT